jgi:hypothetical protein
MEGAKYLSKFSRGQQHKEKNYKTLFAAVDRLYHWFLVFLSNNIIEQYEERIIYSGSGFVIGGAYDFRARRIEEMVSAIYDFKGVTSFWRYSFPTDPQIPIYSVLKQMQYTERGSKEAISLNSGYIVNLTSAKTMGDALQYIPVDTQFVLNNLVGIMTAFVRSAKELYRLQLKTSDNQLRYYTQAPINAKQCSTGNYDCYYKSECNTLRFGLQNQPDTRVFDSKHESTFSVPLMNEAMRIIRKNTTDFNMEHNAGISSGSELQGKDIDALFESNDLF